ncbi:MAG: hypothetical protein KJ571_04300 [Bacteroidetes bacterium]|nr:hypothetical protein [Bacteroidota bacterium]
MESINSKKVKYFILLLLIPTSFLAQDKPVYDIIGEKISKVAATYGKPTYHDKSSPEMECIFYKGKTNRMVFVGNKDGIYQAEMCTTITEKSTAKNVFDRIITKSISEGFKADTLNAEVINLKRPGTEMDLSLFNNTYAKQYEINLKAKKVAD